MSPGLQREDHGGQLLQPGGPEHSVLPQDAAHEPGPPVHRAHHHRHQPRVPGLPAVPEEVQEQAGEQVQKSSVGGGTGDQMTEGKNGRAALLSNVGGMFCCCRGHMTIFMQKGSFFFF